MDLFDERATPRKIFISVYGNGNKNRLTPDVYDYFGSVELDGKPKNSRFICELSQGEFGDYKKPIYGVTVIRYSTHKNRWEPDVDLSIVVDSKRIARKYAGKLAFTGRII